MTHTTKFIEDVIEGGWEKENNPQMYKEGELDNTDCVWFLSDKGGIEIHEILLQPSAWEACGKVRGWDKKYAVSYYGTTGKIDEDSGDLQWDGNRKTDESLSRIQSEVFNKQHQFITHLQDGKSKEEALGELK